MITRDLIQKFRERANRNYYVLNKYRDYNGKNLWSCICSSMDWISVATSYLTEHPIPERNGNDDLSSVNVYTFISCVDMLFEAVKQLHRVFVNKDTVPFDGEKGIFRDNEFCKDDNNYFKMIRACFGAHSVNLNDYFTSPKKKEKRFASWSGGFFSDRDYGVILYSVCPGEPNISLDISFEEIGKFLERTYGYLEKIISLIDHDEEEYREEQRQKLIPVSKDPVEQLQILREENKKRYNTDYYAEIIDELELLFATDITDVDNLEKVEQYRTAIVPAIDELRIVIQEMNLDEVKAYDEINSSPVDLPHSVGTGFVELADMIFANSYKPPIFLPCLVRHISKYVNISGIEDSEELYVLAKTAMYISKSND